MLAPGLLEKSWFKTPTGNFSSVKAVCCLTLYCCPAWRHLCPQTNYVSCLVQTALAGNKKEAWQVRSVHAPPGRGPAGRAFQHSAHRHEYSAPLQARAGGVPTSPRGPGSGVPGAAARSRARPSGASPRSWLPAQRERGPRGGEAAPQSRGRRSSEPPGETGGGLETTRGRKLGRERTPKLSRP